MVCSARQSRHSAYDPIAVLRAALSLDGRTGHPQCAEAWTRTHSLSGIHFSPVVGFCSSSPLQLPSDAGKESQSSLRLRSTRSTWTSGHRGVGLAIACWSPSQARRFLLCQGSPSILCSCRKSTDWNGQYRFTRSETFDGYAALGCSTMSLLTMAIWSCA